jgi:hypothetical protein
VTWWLGLLVGLIGPTAATGWAQPQTGAGALRSYATIQSIGVEWDITGDDNHNATVAVQYRRQGAATWGTAFPLIRIDDDGLNMLAGSILFLDPATAYDVRLDLADPDGGSTSQTLTVTTRAIPALPTGGRTFHVIPGSGGGDGSAGNPFRGIAAAQAVAQPGDTFLLGQGSYGSVTLSRSGEAGRYIVWKAAGDGPVTCSSGLVVSASHVWLEGVTVDGGGDGLKSSGSPQHVVISRNTFSRCHYCIRLGGGAQGWYIADNVMVGDVAPESGSLSGEGVELGKTGGHVVAHNRISRVADGVSYPKVNVDIYGNDIFDTSDDGIEPDYAYANIRVWGNRIHNALHNGITFQPMNGGPWYVLRNQVVNSEESPLKFRDMNRAVIAHNTLVGWHRLQDDVGWLRRGISRNNLWINVDGASYVWEEGGNSEPADWRTDLDYDGFDWHDATARVFKWLGLVYPDLASFVAATGLESHGLHVRRETCFETFDVPGPPPATVPAQVMTLKAGCNAIDAGAALPNLNDGFLGSAPDLGAYEFGAPPPWYGPRPLADAVRGDVDGDRDVDLADLRLLLRMLTGQEPPNEAAKTLAAPADRLTLADARELIQLLTAL